MQVILLTHKQNQAVLFFFTLTTVCVLNAQTIEQWINAAVKSGFNQNQAKQLVYKTLIGSSHLLEQSPFDAAQLRAKVTSKGGTTQAAMDIFSKGKFDQLMYRALLAAKKRSKELAK